MAAHASGSPTPLRLLLVEDNVSDAELEIAELRRGGFEVISDRAETRAQVCKRLDETCYDIILADYNLPEFRGMETIEILREKELSTPLILVSGALRSVTAVECLKQGATDYVLKDNLSRLPLCVRRALEEARVKTERDKALRDLAAKVEELARSNRDLEQFAYVASHDLQEPLRMVAAYTQLLAERYRGKLDATADKYIGYASEGAVRMQALIHDLLTFSRVGREGRAFRDIDCNKVVDEALRNLSAAVKESGVVVTRASLPRVRGDHSQLVQLFQNLIGNAIKFRGELRPTVAISAERDGDEWMISVADNGIGIAREHKDQIFVIFQRLHTRSEYPGNGIGLAICKKIVEQHRGKIGVESEPGRGSIFRLTLPAAPADKAFSTVPYEAYAAHPAGR